MTSELTPAIAYMRCSGRGQVDGDSFPRQREAIERWASRNGYKIVQEFRDEGVSGTNDMEDRPGLVDVGAYCEAYGVKVIIIENAGRLARDLMVQEVIISKFRGMGVSLFDSSTGFDIADANDDDPTRTLIRQILGAVMQFDKVMISMRLRAARLRIRKERGRCEGAKNYGEDPEKPDETKAVELMLRLYDNGSRAAAIADMMNGSHYRPRKSRVWTTNSVSRILMRYRGRSDNPAGRPKGSKVDGDVLVAE